MISHQSSPGFSGIWILEKSKLKHLSESEYFYPIENWPAVLEIFKKTERALYDLVENPSIGFSGENKITHFLGNGIQTYSRLVEHFLNKLIVDSENEDRQTGVEAKIEKNKLDYFRKNKEIWDHTLHYLDYMADEENSWILVKEITDEEGYLGEPEIREIFKVENGAVKNPREDLDRLKFINFFTRLEGSWSSGLKDIKGMEELCQLITEENFDPEFDKLKADDYLDREKAREYMRKCKKEKFN